MFYPVLCLSPCRLERFELTLQSGRQTSQQSSEKHGDVWASRFMISSSVLPQLNANCPQSWDSALPLSSLCRRGPCRSISMMNGTGTRGRPDSTAWPHLWPEMVVCSWTVLTQREEMSQSLNTSNRERTLNVLSRVYLLVKTGGQSAESWQQSSNNENVVLCDISRYIFYLSAEMSDLLKNTSVDFWRWDTFLSLHSLHLTSDIKSKRMNKQTWVILLKIAFAGCPSTNSHSDLELKQSCSLLRIWDRHVDLCQRTK